MGRSVRACKIGPLFGTVSTPKVNLVHFLHPSRGAAAGLPGCLLCPYTPNSGVAWRPPVPQAHRQLANALSGGQPTANWPTVNRRTHSLVKRCSANWRNSRPAQVPPKPLPTGKPIRWLARCSANWRIPHRAPNFIRQLATPSIRPRHVTVHPFRPRQIVNWPTAAAMARGRGVSPPLAVARHRPPHTPPSKPPALPGPLVGGCVVTNPAKVGLTLSDS